MTSLTAHDLTTPYLKEEDTTEKSLRPRTLGDFIGQEATRANLRIFIEAARTRGEALDHVLFCGPPGLGKTTLAQIISTELGVNARHHEIKRESAGSFTIDFKSALEDRQTASAQVLAQKFVELTLFEQFVLQEPT